MIQSTEPEAPSCRNARDLCTECAGIICPPTTCPAIT